MRDFFYRGGTARIVFGNGASARIGSEIEALGCRRPFILSTSRGASEAEAIAGRLGGRIAGIFSDAVMHTPVEVSDRAAALVVEAAGDCLVSLGGGSTIGLGKAVSWRTGLPQLAVPTTYAGSEVTPILGQTENGAKTTLRNPKILPRTVIYDPELTLDLPVTISSFSGLNAIAHAVEALYAQDRNPISSLMAAEGLRAMRAALPAVVAEPCNLAARGEALYGAWLCGTVLGTVGMALHHKLCHVLGGSFGLPHAETHAVMLPHTAGFNAAAVPGLLAPLTEIFAGAPGPALFGFAGSLGAPRSLRQLGLKGGDLDRVADIASASPYPNPRPLSRAAIRNLLQDAWDGRAPSQ